MPEETATGRSLPYGTLSQNHPDYDGRLLAELEDLYEGGYRILKNADRYLKKLPNEHQTVFESRCETTSYQPYFGQIVDQFVSDLFGQPITVAAAADADNPETPGEEPDAEFYGEFASDVDRRGTPLVDVLRAITTTALKHRTAILQIDAPTEDEDEPALSRAEEEERGTTRLYAYEIPVDQLIDWECDDDGNFVWAILNKRETRRESPLASRDLVRETFTLWTLGATGAEWARFVIDYKPDSVPNDDTPVHQAGGGSTSFERIPLLRFELPKGLWVGNKIGPQAREHFQRRSALVSAENKSLVAIPLIKLGPEMSAPGEAIPSEKQQDPGRGRNPVDQFERKGFTVLGAGDDLEYVEPDGGCYEIVDKQLGNLKDEMFRVNHLMAASVSPGPSALGRSGLSKQEDGKATTKVLAALGRLVRQFSVRVYDTIAAARGDDVVWMAHGLDTYETDDREDVLAEATQVDLVSIPSTTFKRAYKYAIAKKLLPGADPRTLDTIKNEIEDGVDHEDEMRDLVNEQTKLALTEPDDDDSKQAPGDAGDAPVKPKPKPNAKQRGKTRGGAQARA